MKKKGKQETNIVGSFQRKITYAKGSFQSILPYIYHILSVIDEYWWWQRRCREDANEDYDDNEEEEDDEADDAADENLLCFVLVGWCNATYKDTWYDRNLLVGKAASGRRKGF